MSKLRLIPSLAFGVMLTSAVNPPAPAGTPSAAQCVRGWTGSLQFTRKQSSSQSKTERTISGKGTQTSDSKMNYDYAAQIAVRETSERDGHSVARARVNSLLTSSENVSSTDEDRCSGETRPRTMSGSFITKTEVRADTPGVDANLSVTMSPDGAYSIGITLPSLYSKTTGSTSSSYSGQCYAKKGSSSTAPASYGRTDSVSFSTDGSHRAPRADPDRLAGSYSKEYGNVTDTLSWNLRRCGMPLRLVDLKFEDMKFPLWEAWREVTAEMSTTDGNIVRMKAIVANDSGEDQSATLMFKDRHHPPKNMAEGPAKLLEQVSFNVAAGEEETVEFLWDTSGSAWFDNASAKPFQKIRAEIWDNNKKIDDLTRNLRVAPRPLVLVHGYWADWSMWSRWRSALQETHIDWNAFPVGERPGNGKMDMGESATSLKPTKTISQNAAELARYIRYAQEFSNAWHVDIVAHTMGGLVARQYIHQSMPIYPDDKPQVAHLLMLGTPNLGSPCADVMSAPLEAVGKRVEVLREMRTSVVAQFNKEVFERKGVEFSALAGAVGLPRCYSLDFNDGFTPVPSQLWTITDTARMNILYDAMAGGGIFSSFVRPRVAKVPGVKPGGIKLEGPKSGTP